MRKKRNNTISIRVTDSEKAFLEKEAKKLNLSLSKLVLTQLPIDAKI